MALNKHEKIAVIAIIFSLIALVSANSLTSQISGVQYIVNNTNLAPNVAGHPFGTGERIQNITYYANNSPIQLMVFAHADTNGQHLALNLSINDTITESIHLRPLAAAENTHAYINAIIPQYANYSVNITNYHHYEWREYPILTGNVSTNITSSGGSSAPCIDCINSTQLQTNLSLKVNKSGDTMTGDLSMSGKNITNMTRINDNNITTNISRIHFNNDLTYYANSSGIQKFSNDHLFDYIFLESHDGLNVNNLVAFQTIDNTGFNFFQGRRARGSVNFSNKSAVIDPLQNGDTVFRVVSSGWNGETWSGSSAIVDYVARGNWNSTSMPMSLDFWTRNDTGTVSLAVNVTKNANLRIAQVGKGITMYSPNGNAFCTTVTNLGALTTVAGECT